MSLMLEPNPTQIKEERIYAEMGLTDEEFAMVEKILGRLPNYTETGLFSVMWSEHCSYKNSKPVLRKFPTTGERVLQGPGEGAGIVDIGDNQAVVFKMEAITILQLLNHIKEQQQALVVLSVTYSLWEHVQ